MDLAFAFFILALILLVALVTGGLRVVDRIVTGGWGIHPQCKKPRGI